MKDHNAFLKDVTRKIIKRFNPKQIILFGSYAYGKPSFDSDLDILVVKNTRLPFAERSRQVSQTIGTHQYPLDFVMLTPGEIKRRLNAFDPFLEEALSKGRILYERNR